MCVYMFVCARVKREKAFSAKAIKAHKAQTKTKNNTAKEAIIISIMSQQFHSEGDNEANTDDHPLTRTLCEVTMPF